MAREPNNLHLIVKSDLLKLLRHVGVVVVHDKETVGLWRRRLCMDQKILLQPPNRNPLSSPSIARVPPSGIVVKVLVDMALDQCRQ